MIAVLSTGMILRLMLWRRFGPFSDIEIYLPLLQVIGFIDYFSFFLQSIAQSVEILGSFCPLTRSADIFIEMQISSIAYNRKKMNTKASKTAKRKGASLSKSNRPTQTIAQILYCLKIEIIVIIFRDYSNQMSLFLLEQVEQMAWNTKKTQFPHPQKPQNRNSNFFRSFDDLISAQIKKHRDYTEIVMVENSQFKRYSLLLNNLYQSYKGIFSFIYYRFVQKIVIKIDIINPDDYFFKMHNRSQFLQIIKNIISSQTFNSMLTKVYVNPSTYALTFEIPYFYSHPSNLNYIALSEEGGSLIINLFKQYIQPYLPLLEYIKKITTPMEKRTDLDQQNKMLDSVYRYIKMVNIPSHISQSLVETEQEINHKEKERQAGIKKILSNQVPMDAFIRKSVSLLYYERTQKKIPKVAKDYNIVGPELKFIRSITAMPTNQRSSTPNQTSTILNHIIIQEPSKLNFSRINEGGFSSIFMSQVKYCYVGSVDGKQEGNSSYLQKWMVLKKETEGSARSRVNHQLEVLKHIKNGHSTFLPKYYIATNATKELTNSLFMDFIPYPNLDQYRQNNKLTFTLLSKLYMAFSLIQGLRYLRNYKIVHLDLKPQNVMTFSNMLVKIIDFGQSFHPDVVSKNYKPGVTPPYCCPEVVRGNKQFNSKSDVFSFGVVLYELIYGKTPFRAKASSKENYLNEVERWNFVPQECQNYGQQVVIRIINNAIGQCLSWNQQDRPQLDWLAVVIRLCFELIV